MKKLISIVLAVTLITTSIPPKAAEASFFTDPQEVEIPVAQESGKVSSSSLTNGHSPNVPIFSQSPMQIENEPESVKLEVEEVKAKPESNLNTDSQSNKTYSISDPDDRILPTDVYCIFKTLETIRNHNDCVEKDCLASTITQTAFLPSEVPQE
jgi:hypothetical protein